MTPLFIASVLQNETNVWLAKIKAAGSSVTMTSIVAHDIFIRTLKSKGLRSLVKRLNTFGANDLTGALFPIICDAGNAADTNHNFISGDFSLSVGITGDGATKYLDTGLIPSVNLSSSTVHLSVVAFNSTGNAYAGCSDSNGSYTTGKYGTSIYYDLFGGTIGVIYNTAIGILTNTFSSGVQSVYQDSTLSNSTGTSGSLPALSALVFGRQDPTPDTFTASTLGGYSMGSGFTAQNVSDYNLAFSLLNRSLGRLQMETSRWKSEIASAGSSVSGPSLTAHNNFVISAKTKGYFSQIQRLNTYGANDLAGSLIPIINTAGGASDTNNNFVSGDFSLANGLTGDGVTKYLDTGFNPSTNFTTSSGHMGVVNSTSGSNIDIGAYDGSLDTTLTLGFGNVTMTTPSVASLTGASTGFWLASRTSSTSINCYRNLVIAGSDNTLNVASGANAFFFVFARNQFGTAAFFSSTTQQGYTLGLGMTTQQGIDYYNDLGMLMTALGRTIPV